jgi:hypothetical protein
MQEIEMSTFVSPLADAPAAGIAATVLNLLVALGLIAVSVVLGIALSLLVGLPALVTEQQRTIRAQVNRGMTLPIARHPIGKRDRAGGLPSPSPATRQR